MLNSTIKKIVPFPTRLSPATRFVHLEGPFPMKRGGELPEVRIAYESWGEPSGDNTVLLFPGLSPSAHAASSPEDPSPGWWEFMIGPGKALDTRRLHVVCINALGSCFGSTGPASVNPATGRAYGMAFPELTVEDIARAGKEALEALGLEGPRAVVGASLGGMAALAFAVQFPGMVQELVAISAAACATPLAIALRSLQREIIRADPAWKGGNYEPGEGPIEGMRMARKLGLLSYRSGIEWQRRFGRERVKAERRAPFDLEFQVESYLEANARKFIHAFDANCYLYLSRAMDLFDLAEHGGSLEEAAARMGVERALVVGVETDFLFPLEQQKELASALEKAGKEVIFAALPSIQGHDAFLVDKLRFSEVIGTFFRS